MVIVMKKQEKLVFYIIIICVLIFVLNKILNLKDLNYTLKVKNTKFSIKENYNKEYYNLEIKNKDYIYNINIYASLKDKRKIVNNIYYYSDKKYECILPIINNKVLTDVMCYKDDIIYNYNSIKGENSVCLNISIFIFSFLLSFTIDLYNFIPLTDNANVEGIIIKLCIRRVIIQNKIPFPVPNVKIINEIV